jgi:acetylornithine/succinyldiaminopimelate/putrescine aminotransferase
MRRHRRLDGGETRRQSRFKRQILQNKAEELASKHKIIKEVRGLGLMLGMELRYDVYGVMTQGIK